MTNDVGKLNLVYAYNGYDNSYVGNGNKLSTSNISNALLRTPHIW